MPRRILIIQGHPDPAPSRFCRALADAYADGARATGHSVSRIDLAQLDFPLLRTQDDFTKGSAPEILLPAQKAIVEAEHIVFVFPLWLGTMPALLKAFLEQVMRPGIAFAYPENGSGFQKTLLKGRSARIVVTMGMPAFFYRWWFFEHGIRGMRRNILQFVGLKPVGETLFGMIETVGDDKRKQWLERMRALGRKAA